MIELDIAIKDKYYANSPSMVLKDIQFSVKPGEFIAIIGPSGSGKTTLLNMLSGLEDATGQKLLWNAKALNDCKEYQLGYVFQQPRLMPWLTVNENIQLVLPTVQEQKIETLLTQVGLAGKGDYYPKQLSGGMQRRVAIARAFAVNPELILLDEPFNSLDAPTAAKLRLLLVNLCKSCGSTVIFVTHDLSEAINLADRIIFMSNSPSSIIHQVTVDLPKPRKGSGNIELAWQAKLMNQYPQILSGSLCSD
ncbi:ABC transporter ATP-binding protein [Colwellia sp. MB02u-10]|jgi:NitT/TauT family transport system ATP-binding protein|uniref:ABC transporter ATP-binding protein n=1 Tax=Colwellia sp. MB02u-10 TaxID=2759828 RepID=UPI0015F39164|nr:ABC transporter ATP-binding protein [Colwellia sp. MB02u-10]MBA6340335.1 ABC transporter ATP-binding protein [Colwellia sp. MB02u-10]